MIQVSPYVYYNADQGREHNTSASAGSCDQRPLVSAGSSRGECEGPNRTGVYHSFLLLSLVAPVPSLPFPVDSFSSFQLKLVLLLCSWQCHHVSIYHYESH